MKLFRILALFWASLACAQVVPDLYIVELREQPAAAAGAKDQRRLAVASEQLALRRLVEQANAEVLASTDTVLNALVVKAPGGRALLESLPGVKKVYPVLEMRLELDRAAALHNLPAAWNRVGGDASAGAGIRIGIIDSGIDWEHPAFQAPGLVVPEGFPKTNESFQSRGTNSKVIVARSYEDLLSAEGEPQPEDRVGHGTAVAMAAAGVRHKAPFGEIAGMAPGAFLGSYKVFGDGESTRTDVVIKALDDAVKDGMDIVNISLGTIPAPPPEADPLVAAVERATAAGVLVVTSAGNGGPDPQTLSSPSSAPSVIAAGASWSDRLLAATAVVGDAPPYIAVPGSGPTPGEPLQAEIADVAAVDATGLACASLPDGSLQGKIVLILRGECFFEDKLNFAQRAGAVAALVYTDAERDVVIMGVGEATLPAMMVAHADGLRIKAQIAENPGITARLTFAGSPVPVNPNRVASFSSRGPGEGSNPGPDLVAVGVEIYTARTARADNGGSGAGGYAVVQGTSFSSPIVAGAAAVLKAARKGLSPHEYRSLLINSADPLLLDDSRPAPVWHAGAGSLNVGKAIEAPAAIRPTVLHFGIGGGDADIFRQATLRNLGEADTFSIRAEPFGSGKAPIVEPASVALGPGESALLAVRWRQSSLAPGSYEGVLIVEGTRGLPALRVPYWYGIPSNVPAFLTILDAPESGKPGATVRVLLRITDDAGLLAQADPTAELVEGDGSVGRIQRLEDRAPGLWRVELQLGPTPGRNVFRLRAGDLVRSVLIQGR